MLNPDKKKISLAIRSELGSYLKSVKPSLPVETNLIGGVPIVTLAQRIQIGESIPFYSIDLQDMAPTIDQFAPPTGLYLTQIRIDSAAVYATVTNLDSDDDSARLYLVFPAEVASGVDKAEKWIDDNIASPKNVKIVHIANYFITLVVFDAPNPAKKPLIILGYRPKYFEQLEIEKPYKFDAFFELLLREGSPDGIGAFPQSV